MEVTVPEVNLDVMITFEDILADHDPIAEEEGSISV